MRWSLYQGLVFFLYLPPRETKPQILGQTVVILYAGRENKRQLQGRTQEIRTENIRKQTFIQQTFGFSEQDAEKATKSGLKLQTKTWRTLDDGMYSSLTNQSTGTAVTPERPASPATLQSSNTLVQFLRFIVRQFAQPDDLS